MIRRATIQVGMPLPHIADWRAIGRSPIAVTEQIRQGAQASAACLRSDKFHSTPQPMNNDEVKSEPLEREADHVIEEARMVLPGIQALFGFQLIAVFNNRFETALLPQEQSLHLASLVLITLAIGLIMAPAAYHRQAERGRLSRYFTNLASNLLTWAMAPLLLGIVLDVYLVSQIILKNRAASIAVAAALFAILVTVWFVFPRIKAKERNRARNSG
jgi:Family of unknown function (DUF6328)